MKRFFFILNMIILSACGRQAQETDISALAKPEINAATFAQNQYFIPKETFECTEMDGSKGTYDFEAIVTITKEGLFCYAYPCDDTRICSKEIEYQFKNEGKILILNGKTYYLKSK